MRRTMVGAAALVLCAAYRVVEMQESTLTPRMLAAAVAAKPSGAEADALADRVRAYFGAEALKRGAPPKIDELTIAWALEWPTTGTGTTAPRVSADIGNGFNIPLTAIG